MAVASSASAAGGGGPRIRVRAHGGPRARSCLASRPLPEQRLPDAETGAAAARGQQHGASLPAAVIRAVAGAARYNMAAG